MSCPRACPDADCPPDVGWAPCCRPAPADAAANALVPAGGSPALRSLELGRLLAETRKLSFRALGTCMFPSVRPGDLLHIAPRPAGQIQVGEIAVYRRAGRFFGHRTVATGVDEGGAYIVARSDQPGGGVDTVYDGDLLGVVSAVERRGRRLPPAPASPNPWQRVWVPLPLACSKAGAQARTALAHAAAAFQGTGAYGRLVRLWVAHSHPEIDFVIRLPLHAGSSSPFSRKLTARAPAALDVELDGALPARWTITLRADRRAAAYLAFVRRPAGCPYTGWWLEDASLRPRFRGSGLEEQLFAAAEPLLARSGADSVRVCLPTGARDPQRLCRALGFAPALRADGAPLQAGGHVVFERKVPGRRL